MEVWILRAAIAFVLICGAVLADAGVSPEGCRRISAGESILIPPETCSLLDVGPVGVEFPGVVEGDEIALQRAASIVISKKDQYVAVLFYASWCPFSKKCLPNFNSMASLFPTVPHFAFEESVIRPSILSRYGVHGFPTLFLLHSSMPVRYHGSRSTSSLTAFYSNVTGIKPASPDKTTMRKAVNLISLTEQNSDHENCPFSWARSPEKLLRQETYLTLACSFLILRLMHSVLPKLMGCLISMRNYSQVFLHQTKRGFGRLNPSSRRNLKEGAINAKAWASKSLASVSIGEPSGRTQSLLQ
ncbi:5'-adenylylsulfate reductase-like 3 [Phalaenopsis equestris]|uniref:5'-adenylylsulfate reductase-like 3 n=1 Tax=Phalaenopsis equestris TaxID=78828 RepID=UPI0009E3B2C3|nr:5'-adenylylsulfate reductase-like 3 [Phalaenopsis equestris]